MSLHEVDRIRLSDEAHNSADWSLRETAICALAEVASIADAVNKTHDQTLLTDIARNAADPFVRLAALEKVRRPDLVADTALNAGFCNVRISAVNRCSDARLLEWLALHDADKYVREAALGRCANQALLGQVASDSTQLPSLRAQAAGHLDDQHELARLALQDADEQVRWAAVRRLDRQDVLGAVADKDASERVRREAEKRIDALNSRG